MRHPLVGCLLAFLCAATPSFAGSVYIPIVGAEIDGISYSTEVTVHNTGFEDAQFSNVFHPADTDGTAQSEDGQTILLLAGRLVIIGFEPDQLGMLEVETAPELIFTARLVPDSNGEELVGAQLPVVTADNLQAANSVAHVQGWMRDSSRVTDFAMFNLGGDTALCSISLLRAGGGAILSNVGFPWKPLSFRHFPDALGLLGETAIADVRLAVSCDQRFFPFALVTDRATGELMTLDPSGLGSSSIAAPGAPFECAPGAICFGEPGVFHVPSPAFPVFRKTVNPPAGTYSRLRALLTVTNGGWNSGRPSGVHNIFWLVQNARNRDMFGYVNVKGPNSNQIFIRHGFNLTQEQKPRVDRPLAWAAGDTYHFEYIYDTAQNFIQLTVTDDAGNVKATLGGVPNIGTISFGSGNTIDMDFGFVEGLNPNEPPTYGWGYTDLVLELTP